MKKFRLFIIVILPFALKAQTQNKILFDYDVTGNQVLRTLCLNCNTRRENKQDTLLAKVPNFERFFENDVISYYPNPVKEELHLKWELTNDNSVESIQIYSLSGQQIKKYNNLKSTDIITVSFLEYSAGVYNLTLFYTDGKQKTIKIIKQ